MNQLVGIILGIALMIGGFLSFSALAPVNAAIESEDLSIQKKLIIINAEWVEVNMAKNKKKII